MGEIHDKLNSRYPTVRRDNYIKGWNIVIISFFLSAIKGMIIFTIPAMCVGFIYIYFGFKDRNAKLNGSLIDMYYQCKERKPPKKLRLMEIYNTMADAVYEYNRRYWYKDTLKWEYSYNNESFNKYYLGTGKIISDDKELTEDEYLEYEKDYLENIFIVLRKNENYYYDIVDRDTLR